MSDKPLLKEYNADCIGPLDFPMQSSDAKELEKQLDSGEYSPIKLTKSTALEAFLDGEKADISTVIHPSLDKEGEIVDPDTVSWDQFTKSGSQVTLNHNYREPPIGKSLWQKKISGGIWKAKTQYAPRPETYPKDKDWIADTVYSLIKFGVLKGKSVGGIAKYREVTQQDIEKFRIDNPKLVKAIRYNTIVHEYTVCTIGMNDNALVEAVSKSYLEISKAFVNTHLNHLATNAEIVKYFSLQDAKHQIDDLIIKEYVTVDDFKEQEQMLIAQRVDEINLRIPELVENSLKRYLGKVC